MTAFTLPATRLDVHPLGDDRFARGASRAAPAAEASGALAATPGWVLPLAILCAPLVLLGAVLLPLVGSDVTAATQPLEDDDPTTEERLS